MNYISLNRFLSDKLCLSSAKEVQAESGHIWETRRDEVLTYCFLLGAHLPSHISWLNKHKSVLFHNRSFLTVKRADSKHWYWAMFLSEMEGIYHKMHSTTHALLGLVNDSHMWIIQRPTEILKINVHFTVRHVAAGLQWGAFLWDSVCHCFCKGTSSSLKTWHFSLSSVNFEQHSDTSLLSLHCRNRAGYTGNKYTQPYSYNENQHYQQYPDYYPNWDYDQSTGSYDGYDYSQYDYSSQVGCTNLRISTHDIKTFQSGTLNSKWNCPWMLWMIKWTVSLLQTHEEVVEDGGLEGEALHFLNARLTSYQPWMWPTLRSHWLQQCCNH